MMFSEMLYITNIEKSPDLGEKIFGEEISTMNEPDINCKCSRNHFLPQSQIIFYFNQDFSGLGVVLGTTPHSQMHYFA